MQKRLPYMTAVLDADTAAVASAGAPTAAAAAPAQPTVIVPMARTSVQRARWGDRGRSGWEPGCDTGSR